MLLVAVSTAQRKSRARRREAVRKWKCAAYGIKPEAEWPRRCHGGEAEVAVCEKAAFIDQYVMA